jgi:hypothetical protein
VESGQIVFRPVLLRASEWRDEPATFEYTDVLGVDGTVDLPAGSLAFTFCQVPVVYKQAETLKVRAVKADGTAVECPHGRIPADLSQSIFGRLGEVDLIEVGTPAAL